MTRSSHAARSITSALVSQGSRSMAGRRIETPKEIPIPINPIPRDPLTSAFTEVIKDNNCELQQPEDAVLEQGRWLTRIEAASILDVLPSSIPTIAKRKEWRKKYVEFSADPYEYAPVLYLESDVEKYLYARSPSHYAAAKSLANSKRSRLTTTEATEKLEQFQFPEVEIVNESAHAHVRMTPLEVLGSLSLMGIHVRPRSKDILTLDPISAVPAYLLEQTKIHKCEILTMLGQHAGEREHNLDSTRRDQEPEKGRLETVLTRLETMVKNADVDVDALRENLDITGFKLETERADLRRILEATQALYRQAEKALGVIIVPVEAMDNLWAAFQSSKVLPESE